MGVWSLRSVVIFPDGKEFFDRDISVRVGLVYSSPVSVVSLRKGGSLAGGGFPSSVGALVGVPRVLLWIPGMELREFIEDGDIDSRLLLVGFGVKEGVYSYRKVIQTAVRDVDGWRLVSRMTAVDSYPETGKYIFLIRGPGKRILTEEDSVPEVWKGFPLVRYGTVVRDVDGPVKSALGILVGETDIDDMLDLTWTKYQVMKGLLM